MPLHGRDSISSVSCFSNSLLQSRHQTLLRNTALHQAPHLLRKVHCYANLSPEVSKAVLRLKKQGIQVTPKVLHRLKKKEACKSDRRVRKEREKADRVTDPVWYDWPEEQVVLEKRRLGFAQSEEDEADDFLSFVDEARPMKRIVVQGVDSVNIGASNRVLSSQKRGTKLRSWRKVARTGSETSRAYIGYNQASPLYEQSVAPMLGLNLMSKTEGLQLSNASEVSYPWSSAHIEGSKHASTFHPQEGYGYDIVEPGSNSSITDPPALIRHNRMHNPIHADEDIMRRERHTKNSGAQGPQYIDRHTYTADYEDHRDEGIISHSHTFTDSSYGTLQSFDSKHSHALKELLNTNKESLTSGIEKFLDDEIEEAPKRREFWVKEVGLVKERRAPFSREVKERVLALRKGDLSVLYEKEDSEDEENEPDASSFPFDGRRVIVEDRKIQRLAARLDEINYWTSKVHFSSLMHSGRMKLTEDRVLRIIQILGEKGNWRRAMQVAQWVHKRQHYQFYASKFVLTTLLSILGKARRPVEALNVFNVMRETSSSYPDMAAYHAIATILGQAGHLRELLHLMESLEFGPPQPIKFVKMINWNSYVYPDIVVYNAVLTACIATKEWTGVSWTWAEFEMRGLKPNGATFGLTIEAMVKANKFDQVVRFYKRMEKAGFPPNAQTYKCLVEAFGKERMTDEASALVKDMEASGIVGNASVYFALACSFCVAGRLKEALVQVRRMKELPSSKPDVITYTGLIRACHRAGRIQDAIFLFNHMQHTCVPNVRTCNEMIKIYGWNNMFEEARNVYEGVKKGKLDSCFLFDDTTRLSCDSFTFELMLKAAVVSEQWDYFDAVYWDMTAQGYHLCGRTNQWLLLKVARQKKVDVAHDMLLRLRKSGEIAHLRFYEALLLSCTQAKRFHDALVHMNDMRIDGYGVFPVIQDLRMQVGKETWDSFLHKAHDSRVYNIFHEELCDVMSQRACFSKQAYGLCTCWN